MTGEELLHEIEILLKPLLIHSQGVDFGPDNTPIKSVDLQKCDMLTIQNYKGYQVKIIVKKV
jgi:hypothetical protein